MMRNYYFMIQFFTGLIHSIWTKFHRSLLLCVLLTSTLQWCHNGHDSVSNHQPHDGLLNRLSRRRSRKTSKLRVTGLCAGNSPGTGESQHKWPVTRKMFPFDDVIMKPSVAWLKVWRCTEDKGLPELTFIQFTGPRYLNILRPRQNFRHLTDEYLNCISFNENVSVSIKISLKFVPKDRINNILALVKMMTWHRPGDKPLSEPIMVTLLTYVCVTRHQRVKHKIHPTFCFGKHGYWYCF